MTQVLFQQFQTYEQLLYRCNIMADDFNRDETSGALINSDDEGFERYKKTRARLKKTNNLEQRVAVLEEMVLKLVRENKS